jgi:tripartite-type tricarboxylate transporter receptor subunit TctC
MFIQRFVKRNVNKGLVIWGAVTWILLVGPALGATVDFPTKPITINVGFAPGGGATPSSQIFSEYAKKYLPKPTAIVVGFKPGAASAVAADFVLKQPADGYNLLWFPPDLFVKMVKDRKLLHFGREDFIPIGCLGYAPAGFTVNRESDFKKVEDFLSYAKQHPGGLSYGHAGVGGTVHLTGELIQIRCGIKLNTIPFSGAAPALTALLGKHIDAYFGTLVAVLPHIKPGGGLRLIAVFARERWNQFPDVPTMKEKGFDIDRINWFFLAAPKGTPAPVVNILRDIFKKTADDPQVKEALVKAGHIPEYWGPEEIEKKANDETELAKEIMTKAGLLQ